MLDLNAVELRHAREQLKRRGEDIDTLCERIAALEGQLAEESRRVIAVDKDRRQAEAERDALRAENTRLRDIGPAWVINDDNSLPPHKDGLLLLISCEQGEFTALGYADKEAASFFFMNEEEIVDDVVAWMVLPTAEQARSALAPAESKAQCPECG